MKWEEIDKERLNAVLDEVQVQVEAGHLVRGTWGTIMGGELRACLGGMVNYVVRGKPERFVLPHVLCAQTVIYICLAQAIIDLGYNKSAPIFTESFLNGNLSTVDTIIIHFNDQMSLRSQMERTLKVIKKAREYTHVGFTGNVMGGNGIIN